MGGFSNDFMGISWWYMYITILIYLDMIFGCVEKMWDSPKIATR